MALTQTTATCTCGASISTAFTSELIDWLNRHEKCLAQRNEVVNGTDGRSEISEVDRGKQLLGVAARAKHEG